jgi:hypothetical protein
MPTHHPRPGSTLACTNDEWRKLAGEADACRDSASEPDIEVGKAHRKRVGGYTVSFARIDGADPQSASP